jgi:hypothetical protein
MSEPRKKYKKKSDTIPSLSAVSLEISENKTLEEIKTKVFKHLNDNELDKAMDKWLKENFQENKVALRDLSLLKSIITEYLDAFITFGYNTKGERIIIQHFKNPKDRDAIMEFFKTMFIKQQHDNFLDLEDN